MSTTPLPPPVTKTKWFPRYIEPLRVGEYECAVRITTIAPLILWRLRWDGVGFRVPVPMRVVQWRGLTKEAHSAALKETP